jgi:predicted membrane protein
MLSVAAILFVVMALIAEVYERELKNTQAERAFKWIKGHALNIAVAIDIFSAEHEEFAHSLKEMDLSHIPLWVWAVIFLMVISRHFKNAKDKRIAEVAAVALVVADTAAETL